MFYFFVFILGLCIGSFLNVCIYRLPEGKSIVFPRSFCPFCGTPIKWFDNVPLLSFAVLGGKCRSCSHGIPLKYPLVELFTALAGLLFYKVFGFSPQFLIYWIFFMLLFTAAVIDLEKQIIPDSISLGGSVLGIIAVSVFRLNGDVNVLNSFLGSLTGGICGFLLMLALAVAGRIIFKKEALGGGDIKLMAMIGVFLGWEKVLLTFFISPFFGAFIGLYLRIRHEKERVPYGPYLAMGALISLFYGDLIIRHLFYY